MIQKLSGRYQRQTALFLALVFYCNGLMAAYSELLYYAGTKEKLYFSGTPATGMSKPEGSVLNSTAGFPGMTTAGNEQKIKISALPLTGAGYSNKGAGFSDKKQQADRQMDIGGPSQPETQSFQSVNSNNMVDLFSGDFSYNIPLLDVGGYPVNIFYRSGIGMDQEASWVGLGWNINPGAITRNMRGLPDDFDGGNDKITKTNYVKDNNTTGVTLGAEGELAGFPMLSASANLGVFYNTYKGWGIETGLNASLNAGTPGKGTMTAGLSFTNNSQEGLTISPSLSVTINKNTMDNVYSGTLSTSLPYNTRAGLKGLQVSLSTKTTATSGLWGDVAMASMNRFSSFMSFAYPSYTPTISVPYTNRQFSFTGKLGAEYTVIHAPDLSFSGYGSTNYIADADVTSSLPAYGYLHYQSGSKNPSGLLDFNREKEIPYREKPAVPNIAVPSYTYDVFSINGEGTGGSFRAYRGDIGSVNDHYMATKSESGAFSIDLGFGNIFHGGVDVNLNYSSTETGAWATDNAFKNAAPFQNSDSVFEAVYFRNPGEKTINDKTFYDAIGGDDVVTPELAQIGSSIILTSKLKRYRNKVFTGQYASLNTGNTRKLARDKRGQVITCLNAAEASKLGLSKLIENYPVNVWTPDCDVAPPGDNPSIKTETRVNSFRQKNHISEIDVLNSDGRKYVYGLPVYNLREKDVTYSIASTKGNAAQGLAAYSSSDDQINRDLNSGRDNYYNSEIIPAYAHSFLLTAITSPDYVDITGNGISDDDLGDGIKFNYTKFAGIGGSYSAYKWRAPFIQDSVTYSQGLMTDNRDDRASYVYGEKELWYLNSIESKNMVAVFKVEGRTDLYPMDSLAKQGASNPSQRLKQIDLYSKADLVKNGSSAKPIKSVYFAYSYKLCKGVNKPANTNGKLTLDSLWFSYNGSKKRQNIYRFYYNSKNPDYNVKSYDRWGNYKDPLQNPGSTAGNLINNAEYPYALQDSSQAAANAVAWTMDSIRLPSGGRMKIVYESDDYAFVQNKRAGQMLKIASLGNDSNYQYQPALYSSSTPDQAYRYIFIKVPDPVTTKQEVFTKYLDGIEKIYFRLNVQMPADVYCGGYEYVPSYAELDFASGSNTAYGVVPYQNNKMIWIKVKGINISADGSGNYTPLSKAAVEFLRLNLPSKAYPGSDVGSTVSVEEAVNMLISQVTNVTEAFHDFDVNAMHKGWARLIDTSRSLVRLDNPNFKKYGGGQRVKKILIYDNWKAMSSDPGTSNGQRESVYGTEYTYTTTKEVNGVQTTISSGVASYEPMIGGEENPFKQPLEYIEKVAPMAPTSVGYTELPLGESFFPGASVGYSQVRARSINTVNTKSANGYEETKFYTSYDFPTLTDYTPLEDNKKTYKPGLSNFLKINAKNYIGLSQGFKVELNDMNGKIRSQATYPETDPYHPISYTENFYKVDDNSAVFKHLNNTVSAVSANGEVDNTASIGKDVELMGDTRQQYSLSSGANVQLNIDIFVLFVLPSFVPSIWPMPQWEQDLYRSAAMTKVIQRYGILDSVVAIDKGSIISTKNMLYDGETGEVVLSRTQNEFNDPIYNFNYPAHWAYSGMGPAYKNVQASFSNITISHGVMQSNSAYPGLAGYFESGDEILCGTGTDSTLIWAVDNKKINAGLSGMFFIDRSGNPVNGTGLFLKILRSGKRNLDESSVGSVTCLNNPIQTVSGKLKLVLDSTANIITAGTAVYKDFWNVKDAYYTKDTILSYIDTLIASNVEVKYQYKCAATGNNYTENYQAPQAGFGGFGRYQDAVNSPAIVSKYKTLLTFSFLPIPSDATVTSSSLLLMPKNTTGSFYNGSGYCDAGTGRSGCGSTCFYGQNNGRTRVCAVPGTVTYNTSYGDNSFACNTNGVTFNQTQYNSSAGKIIVSNMITIAQGFVDGHSATSKLLIDQDLANYPNTIDDYLDFYGWTNLLADSPKIPRLVLNYTAHSYLCKSRITQSNINPYVTGIYGNWRPDRSIVYYGDRRETDPSVNIADRTAGAIRNYMPYWSFTTGYLSATTDTANWVWNSQTTLFNRKGFELENKDPLGRYNAGQYGYNETMPVSVTQNSRYREQMSDGFEDYSYDNFGCVQYCPGKRFEDFTTASGFNISGLKAHTGRYSMRSPEDVAPILLNIPMLGSQNPAMNKADSSITGDSSLLILPFALAPSGKYFISGWITEDTTCLCQSYTRDTIQLIEYLATGDSVIVSIKTSGPIIEQWQRFEQTFTLPSNTVKVKFKMYTPNKILYLDDIRIHPWNANMKSFVYDAVNLRLVAELDENNYATFYEYDDEGTLVRVKKETRRGVMTIKESRSFLTNKP